MYTLYIISIILQIYLYFKYKIKYFNDKPEDASFPEFFGSLLLFFQTIATVILILTYLP